MRWIVAALTLMAASPVVADESAAQARLDGLTDAQLVSVATDWLKNEGTDCVARMSREIDDRMQQDVMDTVFDMVDVAAADRPGLFDDLNNRIEDLLDDAVQRGDLTISQDADGVQVTVKDC